MNQWNRAARQVAPTLDEIQRSLNVCSAFISRLQSNIVAAKVFPNWQMRRDDEYARQRRDAYSVQIVDRGQLLVYKANALSLSIPIDVGFAATMYVGCLSAEFEGKHSNGYFLAISRCFQFLAAEHMAVDLVCISQNECARIADHFSGNSCIDLAEWNLKMLDKVIFLRHRDLDGSPSKPI